MNCSTAVRGTKYAPKFALLALAIVFAQSMNASAQGTGTKDAQANSGAKSYQTLHLNGTTREQDANDIVTDMRNMLPNAKLYYIPWQNALSIFGSAEDFALARKMLSDLDREGKTYRLTYTITESDGGRVLGARRVTMMVVSGSNATVKQGTRVPILTGPAQGGASRQDTVEYFDVGLRIQASLEGPPDGLRLRTRVEQSSVAEQKSGISAQDPIIRQTELDETSELAQSKPMVLGALDIPGSGHREEIEVSSELTQ